MQHHAVVELDGTVDGQLLPPTIDPLCGAHYGPHSTIIANTVLTCIPVAFQCLQMFVSTNRA